jgi:predicted hotdog family 3-hydroxylacyl-ACP dehydratase
LGEAKLIEVSQLPIVDLIPHSPPMVLIDRIIDYRGIELASEVTITAKSMFYDATQGGVPAWAGIEYMAQTVAALAGIRALEKSEKVKLGFLLGTRRFHTGEAVLREGQTYRIAVRELIKDDSGLACFDCEISSDSGLACTARLNVFEAADLQVLKEKADSAP